MQSVGLGVLHVAFALLVWILSTLLGWIPLVGQGLSILLVIVLCAVTLGVLVLRVRMMFSAYRGEAYVLPYIGQALRRFE